MRKATTSSPFEHNTPRTAALSAALGKSLVFDDKGKKLFLKKERKKPRLYINFFQLNPATLPPKPDKLLHITEHYFWKQEEFAITVFVLQNS